MMERRQIVRELSQHPQLWHDLHRLWTRAVGQPNYDKRDWNDFASRLEKSFERQRIGPGPNS
jgi:hypothetical protein